MIATWNTQFSSICQVEFVKFGFALSSVLVKLDECCSRAFWDPFHEKKTDCSACLTSLMRKANRMFCVVVCVSKIRSTATLCLFAPRTCSVQHCHPVVALRPHTRHTKVPSVVGAQEYPCNLNDEAQSRIVCIIGPRSLWQK